jgi:hypothetical protein
MKVFISAFYLFIGLGWSHPSISPAFGVASLTLSQGGIAIENTIDLSESLENVSTIRQSSLGRSYQI